MAEKDGKKRKRQSNGLETPSKKVAFDGGKGGGGSIKVGYVDEVGPQPVLVSMPGLTAPSIPFKPYAKTLSGRHATAAPKPQTHDLLLQSSRHPRLDYTASPSYLDQNQSHYIAVFDPAKKSLQVRPAHHLSLRATPRKAAEDDKANKPRSFAQQREALGKEFGTKKAKKVIASRTENAITKGGDNKGKASDVQDAILGSMADATESDPAKAQIEADLLAAKPIPKPNISATSVEEAYPLNTLIPSHEARLVPVKDWQDATRAEESITFFHRYPASRVVAIGKGDNTNRLKALRYLTLLLEFHDALQSAGRAGKKVPKKEIMTTKFAAWPAELVDSVRRRFANPANELPKWNLDNLYTHICALSLYVDGWTTNTMDLRMDLKMENRQIQQYFLELGCKVGAPTEREKALWGLGNKAVAATVRVARLKVPLEFPKPRVGRKT